MLEAICRRLGFTFVLASKAGCAAIWEHDSGFINWIPVNLQQQLDFPSHSVLSPVSSTSGGWEFSSFLGRFLHLPSFHPYRRAPALCSPLLSLVGSSLQSRAKSTLSLFSYPLGTCSGLLSLLFREVSLFSLLEGHLNVLSTIKTLLCACVMFCKH